MSNLYPGGQRRAIHTRIFGFEAIQRHVHEISKHGAKYRRGHSTAKINRWTGKPHEHQREIARRLRRQV